MPFWKKSEDPWDQKPKKQKTVIRETDTPFQTDDAAATPETGARPWNLGGRLDEWIEKKRAAAREEDEKKRLPPEKCPWCGEDMEQGFLLTAQNHIHWYPGVYRDVWVSRSKTGAFRVDTIGKDSLFDQYAIAWHCGACKKMVIDTAMCESLADPYIVPPTETEETEEQEETSGE
ncbi:MAG: hypothetical protein HFF84_10165 [Oscillibacter sp.]|nr:hypothetical protein [Oscillibacter sp.]